MAKCQLSASYRHRLLLSPQMVNNFSYQVHERKMMYQISCFNCFNRKRL